MSGHHRVPGGVAAVTPAWLLASLLPLAGCAPRPDPAGPRALVAAWVEMWNAYDLDRVRELFLDDARLSYLSSEREGVIHGMEALLEHHRGFGFVPGGKEQPNRLWVEEVGVDLFGAAAVLTGIWFFQRGAPVGSDLSGEPAALPQRGPVTFVCVFQGGRWWFVHMNFSDYPTPGSS